MDEWSRLVGDNRAIEILGVKLVGITAENGWKFAFSILFIIVLRMAVRLAQRLTHRGLSIRPDLGFWSQQFVRITATILGIVGLASIWFDDPGRLAAGLTGKQNQRRSEVGRDTKRFHRRDVSIDRIRSGVRDHQGHFPLDGETAEGLAGELALRSQGLTKSAITEVEIALVVDQRYESRWNVEKTGTHARQAIESA